jgi:YVTN family beta-propeller protein
MRRLGLLVLAVIGAATAEAAPFAWLAHDLTTKVSRIDLATHETVLVTVGDSPISVAGSLDGLRAYSADYGASAVSIIDAPTAVAIGSIPLASPPMSVAVHTDGARVYALRSDAKVDVIDAAAGTVVKTITIAEFGNPLR